MGHTDAQLERWHAEYFGSRLGLAEAKEDTELIQRRRAIAFQQVMIEWQGVHSDPSLPKIGAYAHTDADAHEAMRDENE